MSVDNGDVIRLAEKLGASFSVVRAPATLQKEGLLKGMWLGPWILITLRVNDGVSVSSWTYGYVEGPSPDSDPESIQEVKVQLLNLYLEDCPPDAEGLCYCGLNEECHVRDILGGKYHPYREVLKEPV